MRKISLDHVQMGMVVGKPVYGSTGQVLLNTGIELKQQHLFYLKQLGINSIYIQDCRMDAIEVDDVVSEQVRSEGRALVAQIIRDVDSPSPNNKGLNVREREINELVASIVEELIENRELTIQLVDIRSVDSYLFAHSVNCAVLSTLMAVKMNFNYNSLKDIALGSLLHDIGMAAIPAKIIKKDGELTRDEYETVKKHPIYGYEIFKKCSFFKKEAADAILQHHERNNGQGYPFGLKGNEISLFAHFLSVADTFDALTSDKPNRKAFLNHQAVEMLMSWGGDYFNLDVLRHFLSNIAAYPVGTHVMLNNGESGYVTLNSPGYALRPVVRILYRGESLSPHPTPYDLDLKEALDKIIVKVLEEKALENDRSSYNMRG